MVLCMLVGFFIRDHKHANTCQPATLLALMWTFSLWKCHKNMQFMKKEEIKDEKFLLHVSLRIRGNYCVIVSLLLRVVPKLYSFVCRLQEPEGYKQ